MTRKNVRERPGPGAARGRALGVLVPMGVLFTGIILLVPTMSAGFFFDDYYQVAILAGLDRVSGLGPLSLYTFADGNLNRMGDIQGDFLPWWAAADLRIDFWRPLTCAIYLIDHALYGVNAVGYHATNLVLWVLLLGATVCLHREFACESGRGWGLVFLAGLFYALDEAHTLTLLWIANRHALLGAMFLALAILHYHRFRQYGRNRFLVLSLVLLVLGLLSSEFTIAFGGWLIAYELCLGWGNFSARGRAAAPALTVLAAYLVYYKAAGHGAVNSGDYVAPLGEPLTFLYAVVLRVPVLILAALTPLSPQQWQEALLRLAREPTWAGTVAKNVAAPVILAILAAMAVLVLVPLLRRDRVARFVGLATLLSLVAQSSTAADNRNLLLPTLGTAWLLGAYVMDIGRAHLETWRTRARARPAMRQTSNHPGESLRVAARWLATAVGLAILVMHAGLAPHAAWASIQSLAHYAREVRRHALTAELPGPREADQARVLLLNTPGDTVSGFYLPWIRLVEGQPWPAGIWIVSVVPGDPRLADQRLTRTGPRSFKLEVPRPGYLSGPWQRVFRKDTNLPVGTLFQRGVLGVELTRVLDGNIVEVEVTLDRPLDDPSVWLLAWNGRTWGRIPAGPVGVSRLMSQGWRF